MTRILKVVSLICFFGFDFGHAAYRSYYLIDAGSSVIAHLGGTITGVLLGFIVLKDVNVERWEKLLKVVYMLSPMVISVGLHRLGLKSNFDQVEVQRGEAELDFNWTEIGLHWSCTR